MYVPIEVILYKPRDSDNDLILVRRAVTQSADRANECPHHLDPPLGVICWIYRHSTMRQIKAALKCILTLYRHKKD